MPTDDFLALIAPYLAQRASQFALKPSHPHRLFNDRPEPISTYHARLGAIYDRSVFGKPELLADFMHDIVLAGLKDLPRSPSQPIFDALIRYVQALIVENELAFDFPDLESSLIHNDNYTRSLRRRLEQLEPILLHRDHILETFADVAVDTVETIARDYLPDAAFGEASNDLAVPLLTLLKRPHKFVGAVFATFITQDRNTTEPYSFAFFNTRNQLCENLLAASNLTLDQLHKNPSKLTAPSNSDLDGDELVSTYLARTPFLQLLTTPVPFRLTSRFSHHHIVATPGAGKTNLISYLLAKDFDEVAKGAASVIVLDSQGDLIQSIVRTQDFAPGGRLHDRLCYIDPTDIEYPLELNFFARTTGRQLTPLEKRTEHSDLVDLLLFLFGALKQEATGRQETLIKAVASLIQEIPDATLMTLNAIFEPVDKKKTSLAKFTDYLARLDPAIQEFFAVDFNSGEFSQTRSQIRARVQSLITDPVFRAMFSATSQKLDFADEMNSGKVILINAYEDLLKTGTEVFGRFFIALAAQAAQARQNVPESRRMATYCYIDECYKFIKDDPNVEKILDTGRKYRLGVIIAHQRLNQLSQALKSAASGAAIKMMRAPIHDDAQTLADQLNTTPEYFDSLPDHAFATRIAGMTRPISLTIPLSPFAAAEHMTDADFAEVRNVMRRKYARADTSFHAARVTPPSAPLSHRPANGDVQQETKKTREPPRKTKPLITGLDANGRIDKALRLLTPALQALINTELPRVHGTDWQQHISLALGSDPTRSLDPYAALKTMLDNWQVCFKQCLTNKARTNVSKALEARNAVAHAAQEIPAADAISYLTAIRDIAIEISADAVSDVLTAFIKDQLKAAAETMHDGPDKTGPSSVNHSANRNSPLSADTAVPSPLIKPGKEW